MLNDANNQHDADITDYQDEDARKNAIQMRLTTYEGPLRQDLLIPVVVRARDFFHTFVGTTLHRRYRRAVPIYLVDDWIVNALGVFVHRAGRKIPTLRNEPVTGGDNRPNVAPLTFDAEVEGLSPLLEAFQVLASVKDMLGGPQLLRTDPLVEELSWLCHELAKGCCHLEHLERLCGRTNELIEGARGALSADIFLREWVNDEFAEDLSIAFDYLLSDAERLCNTPSPPVPGTGFGLGRSSGVLFGNISPLNITAPAILVAPQAICNWANRFPRLRDVAGEISPDSMETWFGVHAPEDRAPAIALMNVIQHELMHAMVALPNDPVDDSLQLFRERWHFYDQGPGFEEGLCDATAAIATTLALVKAENRGRQK
jgi:hypothetical protein